MKKTRSLSSGESGEGCDDGEDGNDDGEEDDDDGESVEGCGDGELSAISRSLLPPLPRLHNATSTTFYGALRTHTFNTTRWLGELGTLCHRMTIVA